MYSSIASVPFEKHQAELARLESQLRQTERRAESTALSIAAAVRRTYGFLESARMLARHYREALLPARRRVVALSQEFYDYMLLGIFELLSLLRASRDFDDLAAWRGFVDESVGRRLFIRTRLESHPPDRHISHGLTALLEIFCDTA